MPTFTGYVNFYDTALVIAPYIKVDSGLYTNSPSTRAIHSILTAHSLAFPSSPTIGFPASAGRSTHQLSILTEVLHKQNRQISLSRKSLHVA